MTDLSRLFRSGSIAGLVLSASAVLTVPALQAQSMPKPLYQSPGVAPVQTPTPQYQLPVTPAITPNATVVEDVVARVNDEIISRSDLERAEQRLEGELAQDHSSTTDAAERQRNLLRDLIDQQLLLSKGKENGINADAEVIRRLDEIRKQNNLPTMEALEQAAASQGVSFEDFKANIKNQIITQQVVRDEVGRSIRMTRGDEQRFYDAHKEMFNQPEQVRLSEILIPAPADASDEVLAQAQKKAEAVHAKLAAGEDFAALAKSTSGGPTAAQGGDLGLFKHGTLAPVLEEKTFALPVGGYTDPIRTRQGFVILKAVDHQQAGAPPLDKIENEVQNAMYQEQIQPALRAYLGKLREESYVDVRPGFTDSGATSKQTKPVFSAYTPPTPKKKTLAAKKRMDARNGRMSNAKPSVQPAVAELDKHGKPKKVKREKVRFGQAPRTALPGASGDDTEDVAALPAANAAPGGAPGTAGAPTAAAPGTALAPVDSNNTVAANGDADVDPAAPKPGPRVKTRFASREVETKIKEKKAVKTNAKIADRAAATPDAATSDEKRAKKVQSSALGLNGDTTKKKAKRKKGDPKERLQEKPVEPKAPLQDNGLPDRLHQVNAPAQSASSASGNPTPDNSKQKQKERAGEQPVTPASADTTTLPPADRPAPGSAVPSQTPPANGTAAPTSSDPVPQTPQQPQ